MSRPMHERDDFDQRDQSAEERHYSKKESDDAKRVRDESKRERDVLLLYGAAFRDIPQLDQEDAQVPELTPRLSPDSTLTALCQLTALRLGAQRSLISLFDNHRQHILAEATCDLSLRPEAPGTASTSLWFGNVSIPRIWGLCEQVLELEPGSEEKPMLVINDLVQSDVFERRKDALHKADMHFYASAALLSPNRAIVGTLSIFDSKPREGLSKDETVLLHDLASSVVDYLNTYTIRDQYRRGERFTRGLVSFAEGASALNSFEGAQRSEPASLAPPEIPSGGSSPADQGAFSAEDTSDHAQTSATTETDGHPAVTLPHRLPLVAPKTKRGSSARHRSIRILQDNILPVNSKSMFSRAANVMMASSDLDGVIILDASVVANGQRRGPGGPGSATDIPSESYNSKSSSSDEGSSPSTDGRESGVSLSSSSSKMCQILGASTINGFNPEHGILLEQDLSRLFREHPNGRIFTYTAGGLSLSSTEETSSGGTSGSSSNVPKEFPAALHPKRKLSKRTLRSSNSVKAMFPKARSVAFIPFWDYERSRWFAGCLCWTNNSYRVLSASVDLTYFKIFSHSIMRELSRLDALASNQAKTTFVASISHELRSPLHGILGTLEFIKDTPLDSFQTSMLNSLNACGTTLLDTINHVMDYAKIGETQRGVSSRRIKSSNTIRLSSKPLKGRKKKDSAFDFSLATEEVIEAVFSGSSYLPVTSALIEASPTQLEEKSTSLSKRKPCFIILEIDFEDDWFYCFPVGSWRRIVMNIFGNAVKYTASGFIHVSLHANSLTENTGAPSAITLTINDSGSGMSPTFLANNAFQPFSQENSHSAGTGLGLSIVRQIIDTTGGKIEVSSEPSVGTRLTVKLALTKPETLQDDTLQRAQLLSILPRLANRRICLLHKKFVSSSEKPNMSRIDEGLIRFTNALATTLEKQLKMAVVQTANWSGHDADIVILPEPSFEYLATIRRERVNNESAPVTVFIAMDALEAATLRSDVRVTNKESVVEIMTQPCGPHKLAFILNRCLDRFGHPEENIQHHKTPKLSPKPSVIGNELPQNPLRGSESLPIFESPSAKVVEPPLSAPAISTAALTSIVPARSPSNENAKSSEILITDDNAVNRKLLVAFMKKHKLQYQEATNGLEALQAYQQGAHKFRAILMDMSMPVMDGMSATRAIREHEKEQGIPRCPIIALTGLASSSAKLEAWSSGIDHFMTKPVNFKALEKLLNKEDMKRQRAQLEGVTDEGVYDTDIENDEDH